MGQILRPAVTPAQMAAALASAGLIPQPASSAPPAVGDTSDKGSAPRFALENHTHRSSVQRAVAATDASGLVSWTFPVPYELTPSVQVTIEVAGGQPYVPLVTALSKTGITVKVLRARTLPAVLGMIFDVFGGSVGAGVPVHIWAAKAS